MNEYIVICQNVVGGDGRPFDFVCSWDGRRYDSKKDAVHHGFSLDRSDDFNVGILEDGKLISFWWMDDEVDANLREIAKEIGVEAAPAKAGERETGQN